MQPRVSASSSLDSQLRVGDAAPPRDLARLSATTALILALAAATALLGRRLWGEWSLLMAEERAVASTAVIGYRNIYPSVSRAERPEPWRRTEGASLLVWSGWKTGEGHRWFKLAAGDCDPATLGDPVGRDVVRAIDRPDVEADGGEVWGHMPEDAAVVGLATGRSARAYPRLVLCRVLLVNDVIDGQPRLVCHDPNAGADGKPDVAVFDARIDGRRVVLGSSGFTMNHRHVLYDRDTESLWVDRGEGLTAFSGPLKGKTLATTARLGTTAWDDWRSDHPDTTLLAGALPAQPPAATTAAVLRP